MNIIITGSLGHIGKPLTQELVEKGHTVTVISSNPDKQSAIEDLGATAAIGSLEDVDFLTKTFVSADALFAMVPPNYATADMRAYYGRIGSNYVQAIGQSGLKRVVNLSSYGADLAEGTGVILGAHDVENLLNALPDVVITHLRPTYFYYNLYAFVDMIRGLGFIGANYGGDDRLLMVAPVDIAVVAAEELQQNVSQPVRYITSDERTASEVAQVLGNAIGMPALNWVVFTDEQARSGMEQSGMPAHIAADMADLGASIHSGAMRQDYDLHPPTTVGNVKLEDFAREFGAVYNA
ncbi:NAD(P)H-binding protein [Spirosoma pollinicola]|uniref:NAD-dependent dehydratase n=1 Tax=Spirosoma pollinicola TaxID=2057025 RepID=A0A2K8Z7J7_9BACT|nr:NAD(P)H-binding protein [Spirosoma pollinicola]AUD05818.1 NAD-dependent dehydratase [Spirosoma pollinicola]